MHSRSFSSWQTTYCCF